jgi:hypothetical protein
LESLSYSKCGYSKINKEEKVVNERREGEKGGREGRERREGEKGGREGRERREGEKGGREGREGRDHTKMNISLCDVSN